MNKILKLKMIASMVIMWSLSLQADDVYNFYFQKAPGPTTVIQGAPGQKSQVITSSSGEDKKQKEVGEDLGGGTKDLQKVSEDGKVVSSVANTVKEKTVVPRKEKWSVKGGVGAVSGQPGYAETYVLGAAYSINKYFDIDGEIHLPKNEEAGNHYFDSPEVAFGVGVTPIHISIFGHNTFEIGAIGGVLYGVRETEGSNSVSKEASTYLGARLRVNFNKNLGMEYIARADQNYDDVTQFSISLAYAW